MTTDPTKPGQGEDEAARIAEEVVAAWWDVPAIETREEAVAHLRMHLARFLRDHDSEREVEAAWDQSYLVIEEQAQNFRHQKAKVLSAEKRAEGAEAALAAKEQETQRIAVQRNRAMDERDTARKEAVAAAEQLRQELQQARAERDETDKMYEDAVIRHDAELQQARDRLSEATRAVSAAVYCITGHSYTAASCDCDQANIARAFLARPEQEPEPPPLLSPLLAEVQRIIHAAHTGQCALCAAPAPPPLPGAPEEKKD